MSACQENETTQIEINQTVNAKNTGILYAFNMAWYPNNVTYKIGQTQGNGNDRIDDEMSETSSAGRDEILKVNHGYIPLCSIQIPPGKTIHNLENELFDRVKAKGAQRLNNKKEHFTNISMDKIIECMNDMIDKYGGELSQYKKKINYLLPEYDEYSIEIGENYHNYNNEYVNKRVEQFFGKKISDIRDNKSLKKNTYKFGGSDKKQKYCDKADFDYLIKRKIIQVTEPHTY